MAQIAASIVTHDEEFKRHASRLLRAGGVPVGIIEGRAGLEGAGPDIVVVDIRHSTPRPGWRRSSACAPAARRSRSSRFPRAPSRT
jgi:hypothetical protein